MHPVTTVLAHAQVNDGAMGNCLLLQFWTHNAQSLGPLQPSPMVLALANSKICCPLNHWTSPCTTSTHTEHTTFEVYNNKGLYNILLGKPWLTQSHALHAYVSNMIHLLAQSPPTLLTNETTASSKQPQHHLELLLFLMDLVQDTCTMDLAPIQAISNICKVLASHPKCTLRI